MDGIIVKLAGVTFDDAQDNIKDLEPLGIDRMDLIREPGNAYDPNAIRVEFEGRYLGYIPKGIARQFAIKMDLGARFSASFVQKNKSSYHDTVGLTVEIIESLIFPRFMDSEIEGFINHGKGI